MLPSCKPTQFLPEGLAIRDTEKNKFADGSIVEAEAPTTRSASHQELLDLAKLPTLYNRSLQDIATNGVLASTKWEVPNN